MRSTASPDQIKNYQENGFVIIDDFLKPEETRELSEAVAQAIELYGDKKILSGQEWRDNKEEFYDNVFVQRLNLWKVNETVRRYMLGAELGRLATMLAGTEGMRVWHDQTLQKKPWANPTAWHLDNPYWSFHTRNAISVWIALEDVYVQNGCMYYLPGSHKLVDWENAGIGPNMDDLFKIYPALKSIDPVPAIMKAGSCGFHNGLTAHAAGPNMTPRWRRAMTCAYMPIGSTFNGTANILTQEQIAHMKVGDVIDDDAHFPIVYEKSWEENQGKIFAEKSPSLSAFTSVIA